MFSLKYQFKTLAEFKYGYSERLQELPKEIDEANI